VHKALLHCGIKRDNVARLVCAVGGVLARRNTGANTCYAYLHRTRKKKAAAAVPGQKLCRSRAARAEIQ